MRVSVPGRLSGSRRSRWHLCLITMMAFGNYVMGAMPCEFHTYPATHGGIYLNYGFIAPSPVQGASMVSNLADDNAELIRQNAQLREQIAMLANKHDGGTNALRPDAPAFCPGVSPRGVVDNSPMKERRQRFMNRKIAPKRLEVDFDSDISSPSASTTCSSGFTSEEDVSPRLGTSRTPRGHLRVTFASEVEVIMLPA